jgi:hypothetical protein
VETDSDLEARPARLAHYKELAELRAKLEQWRSGFLGLLFLVLFVILSQWVHHNDVDTADNHNAIPSQAWSFGEPGE